MSYKIFAERINKALDDIGVPERQDERIEVFAKLVKIPRFKAEAFLNGSLLPDSALLQLLCTEFEVNEHWLLGKA